MSGERILVLSYYYPPDLSAGSFRSSALVDALLAADATVCIDVITTLPNRYGSFNTPAVAEERRERVTIRRVALRPHTNGMVDQAMAFVRFWRTASRLARGARYNLVYATSSRLMTASLGRWIARRTGSRLYLDIRDIFVDTITEVLPKGMALVLEPLLTTLERWTVSGAVHVNLVSDGFGSYFNARYPQQSFSYFTNGVDDDFLHVNEATARIGHAPIRVLYAGNMGAGQGLDTIIPTIARRLAGRATFKLIGDGGRRANLVKALKDAAAMNVEMLSPMSRQALIEEYRAADVLFLHLNEYDAFKRVLPSKIFEYAALGKPVWAGVAGFAAKFLKEEVSNVAVFRPCDAEEAVTVFEQLEVRDIPRDAFVEKFSRTVIMRAMAMNVLAFARTEKGS